MKSSTVFVSVILAAIALSVSSEMTSYSAAIPESVWGEPDVLVQVEDSRGLSMPGSASAEKARKKAYHADQRKNQLNEPIDDSDDLTKIYNHKTGEMDKVKRKKNGLGKDRDNGDLLKSHTVYNPTMARKYVKPGGYTSKDAHTSSRGHYYIGNGRRRIGAGYGRRRRTPAPTKAQIKRRKAFDALKKLRSKPAPVISGQLKRTLGKMDAWSAAKAKLAKLKELKKDKTEVAKEVVAKIEKSRPSAKCLAADKACQSEHLCKAAQATGIRTAGGLLRASEKICSDKKGVLSLIDIAIHCPGKVSPTAAEKLKKHVQSVKGDLCKATKATRKHFIGALHGEEAAHKEKVKKEKEKKERAKKEKKAKEQAKKEKAKKEKAKKERAKKEKKAKEQDKKEKAKKEKAKKERAKKEKKAKEREDKAEKALKEKQKKEKATKKKEKADKAAKKKEKAAKDEKKAKEKAKKVKAAKEKAHKAEKSDKEAKKKVAAEKSEKEKAKAERKRKHDEAVKAAKSAAAEKAKKAVAKAEKASKKEEEKKQKALEAKKAAVAAAKAAAKAKSKELKKKADKAAAIAKRKAEAEAERRKKVEEVTHKAAEKSTKAAKEASKKESDKKAAAAAAARETASKAATKAAAEKAEKAAESKAKAAARELKEKAYCKVAVYNDNNFHGMTWSKQICKSGERYNLTYNQKKGQHSVSLKGPGCNWMRLGDDDSWGRQDVNVYPPGVKNLPYDLESDIKDIQVYLKNNGMRGC